MAIHATDFAGSLCGCRYEKEHENHVRDCLLFYLDGRIRFERYCYGEAACLVFGVWGSGIDPDGSLHWDQEPKYPQEQAALPRRITEVQQQGQALVVDGQPKRYVKTEELTQDRENGYTPWRLFWLRRSAKKAVAR
jgi:hypothetical protein